MLLHIQFLHVDLAVQYPLISFGIHRHMILYMHPILHMLPIDSQLQLYGEEVKMLTFPILLYISNI